MKRRRINRILGWLYDFALWSSPWPWPWSFKVRVWNSLISGMGLPIEMEQKDVSHPIMTMILTLFVWPRWGGRIYRIVTGVTSDVGVPSTYPVYQCPCLISSPGGQVCVSNVYCTVYGYCFPAQFAILLVIPSLPGGELSHTWVCETKIYVKDNYNHVFRLILWQICESLNENYMNLMNSNSNSNSN